MSIKGGCGNSECCASSTIARQISFGSGHLDKHGFWEHPCWTCAQVWKRENPEDAVWPESAEHVEQLAKPQLTQGMFGSEFDQREVYGLRCGQMRLNSCFHNAGWYNCRGEKIGWGDLDALDLRRLQDNLDEPFIILYEQDSFWNFVKSVGVIGSMCDTEPTMDTPGVKYIAEHVAGVVVDKKIYFPAYQKEEVGTRSWRGILITCELQEDLIARVSQFATPTVEENGK